MRRIALLAGLLAVLAAAPPPAGANDIAVREAALRAVEDGLVLDADFDFVLTPRLSDVVSNGVPLYFQVEFELGRRRWYWFDERTASARLQLRLSYHALSRQYRLSTGLLQQSFTSLEEALNVLKRVRGWLVVDRTVGFSDVEYEGAVRMRLDTHMLPKPFQLSALTSRELQLESPWKRFAVRSPQQLPAPVEAREPQKGGAAMKAVLIVGAAIAAVGLFLLATASSDTATLAQHYPLLLAVNAMLAVLLAGVVAYQLLALARRYRARVFGTRLTLRLLTRFAALAVLPGLIVYAVSVQFITRSIESWFDVKVDAALEGGLNLGQQAIDQMTIDLETKARAMAQELAGRSTPQLIGQLERLRAQAGVQEAVVVTPGGRLVASTSEDVSRLLPDLPPANALRQARTNRAYSAVDAPTGRPLSLRVIVPIEPQTLIEEVRFLQLRATVSATFTRSAEAVEAAYRDYRELALARADLTRIYVVTLTFALLMALFVAVAVAATQSNLLAQPLAALAQAMQAVARGDYSRQAAVTSRDELGVLTESFNSMTRQLDEARRVVEANRAALEAAKARLESILAHLSAGVLVFDHQLGLSVFNHGASTIVGDELQAFAQRMREHFIEHGDAGWQVELELKGTGKTLHARGAALPQATGAGYVVAFDDVTQLIQAQRATAWAEVARRLAHEIKNPLTPIQLSAERLEMKLADRLTREDAESLRRATETIVNQVAALKAMVDDFRDYARLPPPELKRLDLNALVGEVLALYETSRVPVAKQLAAALPPVWADGTQIRQVIHNLVQNAQDSLENSTAERRAAGPLIEVRTELAGEHARLAISDNGGGFPEELMARIFEPYVTTKPRGTGLGLAIVKKIVDEHHGSIAIENRPSRGASVSVLLPLAKAA